MHQYLVKYSFILLPVLLTGACASQVPPLIREAPADSPSLEQVRTHTDGYLQRRVRWGGTIIHTENRENATWLTVLGRPLSTSGEPEFADDSNGRFIAIVPGFLDPEVYTPGRRATITGTVQGTEDGKVGDYPYTYTVVRAEAWYLWPEETGQPPVYPGPWWYDPWWYGPGWYGPGWYGRRYYQPWYDTPYPKGHSHHHKH
jgi:outer membrane lipoprotein